MLQRGASRSEQRPPPPLPADVYNRSGGKAALTQLIDPNGQGTWSEETLDTAMLDAWLWVLCSCRCRRRSWG